MKKILLCYFAPRSLRHYTPLDLGYSAAALKEKRDFEVEIVELSGGRGKKGDYFIDEDFSLIEYHKPQAVFFFLDNVLWSGIHALGRAKKIAQKMREKLPDIFIGFQSYKISKEEEKELFESGLAEAIVGGEVSFQELGKILKKEKVPGVSFGDSDPKGADKKKLNDSDSASLDCLPSPYLSGIFDNILAKRQRDSRGEFMAFIYSMFGCPYRCYYCFRSVKHDRLRFFSVERFYDEIEYLVDNFNIKNFFVLDDSFLSIVPERKSEFISEFKRRKEKNPRLKKIFLYVIVRPELIDEESLKFLKSINVVWAQIGLQTINPDLQKYIGRGAEAEKFKEIADWFHSSNIKLHLDIILGLPDDTVDYFRESLDYALALKPFSVQVKQLYLNPGTLFYNNREEYGIKCEEKGDMDTPFVIEARGINEKYIQETHDFTMKRIKEHPEIKWKLLTSLGRYLSDDYFSFN